MALPLRVPHVPIQRPFFYFKIFFLSSKTKKTKKKKKKKKKKRVKEINNKAL